MILLLVSCLTLVQETSSINAWARHSNTEDIQVGESIVVIASVGCKKRGVSENDYNSLNKCMKVSKIENLKTENRNE